MRFEIGEGLRCGRENLSRHHVSKCVALKEATYRLAIPMYVLQHPISIVGRPDTEVAFHTVIPSRGEIGDTEISLEEFELELEAEHDMKVVRQLIGIDTNE